MYTHRLDGFRKTGGNIHCMRRDDSQVDNLKGNKKRQGPPGPPKTPGQNEIRPLAKHGRDMGTSPGYESLKAISAPTSIGPKLQM